MTSGTRHSALIERRYSQANDSGMKFLRNHSRLVVAIAVLLVLFATVLLARPWLGGYVIRTALGLAGATEIRFRTVTAVPSRVVVEDLEFRIKAQVFAARRLTLVRPRWWRFSLGRVQVEGARVALTVDGSDSIPWPWDRYDGLAAPAEPPGLPVESLVLDGEVTVRAAQQPDQRLTVKLEGAPKGKSDWVGSLVVDGPGFKLAGGGTLLGWGTELDFQVHSAEIDLNIWQGFIQHNLYLPDGPWKLGGRLTGVAEGRVTSRRFAATARVSLRDGRMQARTLDIAAEGVEADLEFSDLWKLRTKSGELRLKQLRVGRLPLQDVRADIGLWGDQTLTVSGLAFSALGGRITAAPFKYFQSQREVATILQVDGLDLARLLPLVPEVPGGISGRVNGTLPLRLQDQGVRLESGYLVLQPGTVAELEYNATTLLRSGATMPGGTLEVLKAAGNKPARMRLDELRLDIRPPDVPLGCSARLRLAGRTPDGLVSIDLYVNGAIEKYLDILTVQR